jgi:hypothetical protein
MTGPSRRPTLRRLVLVGTVLAAASAAGVGLALIVPKKPPSSPAPDAATPAIRPNPTPSPQVSPSSPGPADTASEPALPQDAAGSRTRTAHDAASAVVLAKKNGDRKTLEELATPEALSQLDSYPQQGFDETKIACRTPEPATAPDASRVVCDVPASAFLLPGARFHFQTDGGRLRLVLVEPIVD